jgi:hypothetical protein
MILLTPDLRFALRANAINRRAAMRDEKPEPDPVPVVKFFNPLGSATWIATELFADDDTLFGVADLGFGCPELGVFSLSELASVRLPFGMGGAAQGSSDAQHRWKGCVGIERDIGFESPHPISVWADTARSAGPLSAAEQILSRTPRAPGDELPPMGG